MKSDSDDWKFFVCFKEYEELLGKDNGEYWTLFNIGVLEKIVEINPFEERECSSYKNKLLGKTHF